MSPNISGSPERRPFGAAPDRPNVPTLRVATLGRMRRDPDVLRNQRGTSKRIETYAPAGRRLIRPISKEKKA